MCWLLLPRRPRFRSNFRSSVQRGRKFASTAKQFIVMSSFLDANVWLALIWERHEHSTAARHWIQRESPPFLFCRFTQLTVLRLLTTPAILGADVRTMKGAWEVWDRIANEGRFVLLPEPDGLDAEFRKAARLPAASPKVWADAYLKAFAESGDLRLVTFDRALARRTRGALLLRGNSSGARR